MEDIIVPVALFSIAPVIVLVVMYFNSRRNAEMQQTVREAIAQGKELTPETIKALGVRPRSKYCDLRRGIVLIAVAVAFLILGYGAQYTAGIHTSEAVGVVPAMAGVAAFPGLIGLAYILMHFFLGGKDDK